MMVDLEIFFQEKKIPHTEWEIKYHGETHYINSDIVQKAILLTDLATRTVIANNIFSLEFRNGSIVDYLHCLAENMVEYKCNNARNA